MKESNYRGKIYNFSNENLTSYNDLYNFDNSRVLSVIGSGDQYFSSLLYGAETIDLYDINRNAYDYFILKYYSILILSYEEFYNFFVTSNLDNINIYNKVRYHLPKEVINNLDNFIKENKSLSSIIIKNILYKTISNNVERIIPYLQKDNYYQLKEILNKKTLPNVYFYDLMWLSRILDNKEYDLMLTSNIYYYLNINISEYRDLLNKFNANTIQANYCWFHLPMDKYTKNGFEINKVDSIIKNKKDYVLTLKKK